MLTNMTTMTAVTMPLPKVDAEETSEDNNIVEQPTAFILKLFQMIRGAPDEVIAVSSLQLTSSF